MARDERNARATSFDNSDTDGFLSQAGSQAMARLFDKLADIADNDGIADVAWVFRVDGTPVESWRWVDGKYGPSVRVDSDRAWFNPSNAASGVRALATDKRKGYTFGRVSGAVTVRMGANWMPIVELADGAERTVIASVDTVRYEGAR